MKEEVELIPFGINFFKKKPDDPDTGDIVLDLETKRVILYTDQGTWIDLCALSSELEDHVKDAIGEENIQEYLLPVRDLDI
jgi:hypothetical protein